MHDDVIKTILFAEPRRIVYVSCNPATQARDLSLLDVKYRVERVQPVDMFPSHPPRGECGAAGTQGEGTCRGIRKTTEIVNTDEAPES